MNAAQKKRLEQAADEAFRAFAGQGGKPREKWTRDEWLEFLGGWQHARLKNCPGPDTKIRRLGIFISTLVDPAEKP